MVSRCSRALAWPQCETERVRLMFSPPDPSLQASHAMTECTSMLHSAHSRRGCCLRSCCWWQQMAEPDQAAASGAAAGGIKWQSLTRCSAWDCCQRSCCWWLPQPQHQLRAGDPRPCCLRLHDVLQSRLAWRTGCPALGVGQLQQRWGLRWWLTWHPWAQHCQVLAV